MKYFIVEVAYIPRCQQHPAELRVANVRCNVQRGGAATAERLGRGAGVRPHDVSHGAVRAAHGRPEDVVAVSEATGRAPHRWSPNGDPQKTSLVQGNAIPSSTTDLVLG